MRVVITLALFLTSGFARADIFGGDTVVLTQLLTNAIQQLQQMTAMVRNGQDTLSLINDINRGLNDSMQMMRTVREGITPGVWGDWTDPVSAVQKVQAIYGPIAESRIAAIQQSTDQIAAEALTVNATMHKYTSQLDKLGEDIKGASHIVSPGGAQKLTAESLGVLIQSQNEAIRTNAMGVKVSAQGLALQNFKEKQATKAFLETADSLKSAMKNQSTSFETPKF